MLQGDHTVLPATHTRTIPAFTPQPQGVTALWLVLIAPTHEGMARLSQPSILHGTVQQVTVSAWVPVERHNELLHKEEPRADLVGVRHHPDPTVPVQLRTCHHCNHNVTCNSPTKAMINMYYAFRLPYLCGPSNNFIIQATLKILMMMMTMIMKAR